jgi:hypothetical protein
MAAQPQAGGKAGILAVADAVHRLGVRGEAFQAFARQMAALGEDGDQMAARQMRQKTAQRKTSIVEVRRQDGGGTPGKGRRHRAVKPAGFRAQRGQPSGRRRRSLSF